MGEQSDRETALPEMEVRDRSLDLMTCDTVQSQPVQSAHFPWLSDAATILALASVSRRLNMQPITS